MNERRGSFNRVIRIATRLEEAGGGEARVAVEDDYHHFRVGLRHDGDHITATYGEGVRHPFSLCAAATHQLEKLVGVPVVADMGVILRAVNARHQCTHQFDVAVLGITAAARKTTSRCYRIHVPERVEGATTATLYQDDVGILRWDVLDSLIVSPAPYAGVDLNAGFTNWALSSLDEQQAEAAIVLRRGVFLESGRRIGKVLPARLTGACWVQQAEQYAQAVPIPESLQDFTSRSAELTGDDEDWLEFI